MPPTLDDYIDAFNHWCLAQDPDTLRARSGLPWYAAYPVPETLAHIAVQIDKGLSCEDAVTAGVKSLEEGAQ